MSLRPSVEFFWDFSSPYAYLASTQMPAFSARTGADVRWCPMLLGGLFRTIGQVDVPLATFSPSKQRYVAKDLERWAAYWKVPYKFPSRFPLNSLKAMRCYLALPEAQREAFAHRAFRAFWAEDQDLTDEAVLRGLLGADHEAVLNAVQTPAIKQQLLDATQRAADLGVFGAPTFLLDGRELFWGQDRLSLLEHTLAQR